MSITEQDTQVAAVAASPELVRTDTGGAYVVADGRCATIPDSATWEALRRAGATEREAGDDEITHFAGAGMLPSLDITGTFYLDAEDRAQRSFYPQHGTVFSLESVDEEIVRAAFGDPLPLAALAPFPMQQEHLMRDVAPLAAPSNWLTILAYLRTIPPDQVTDPPGLTITPGTQSQRSYIGPENVAYQVTVQEQTVKNVLNDLPVVAPVTDATWPGALVQGSSLASGLLAPIQIGSRARGTLTITTELVPNQPNAPTSVEIGAPSLSAVTTARRELLRGLDPQASAGHVRLGFATITTEQQVSARLGARVSGSGWNSSASVDVSGSLETSRSMLQLTQEFYTVAFEPSGTPAHYFGDDVTVDAVRQFSGPHNPPCYVHQVTYGRIFLFTIESSHSSSMVQAKASLAWDAVVSGNVDAQTRLRDETKAYRVEIATVGVTGATAFQATGGLIDALKALKETADYRPDNPGGVIAYSARYLLDGSVATAVVGPATYSAFVRADPPAAASNFQVFDGPKGVSGGKPTGLVVRPGDHVSVTAFGSVWAGWAFGAWFGPDGDTSQHGGAIGNGTKPLRDVAFSALLYGFGQGWFSWAQDRDFVYGTTRQRDPNGQDRVIGNPATTLQMYLHINDDNVRNGRGGFCGQVLVQRRPLAAVGQM